MQIPTIVLGDQTGRFIQAIESQRGPISVVRHVQDLAEVLGLAQSGLARALLVVSLEEDLTHSLLEQLEGLEVAVCQVLDPGQKPALDGIWPINSLGEQEEILLGISQAVQALEEGNSGHRRQPSQETEESPKRESQQANKSAQPQDPAPQQAGPEEPGKQPGLGGKILTVWGPLGSPGRTTLALNLATLAAPGLKVCLLDADTYGASLGPALGLTDDYSSLAQLCHYADRDKLAPKVLEELRSQVEVGGAKLDLFTGLNRPDRWPEVRSLTLTKVLTYLRGHYDLIILDSSFNLEEDQALAFDQLAPQRNDASLTSVREADYILTVGLADVIGMPRLIKGCDQLIQALGRQPDSSDWGIVINRVRKEAVGPSAQLALQHSWDRFGPKEPILAFLSDDPNACDRARLEGSSLAQIAPQSKLSQEVKVLTEQVLKQLGLASEEDGAEKKMVEKKKGRLSWLTRS